MSIRILLADDHKLMREGIRALIVGERDMTAIAEAEDGGTAVRLAHDLKPDIVIMDIGMPGLNGIEATRQITISGTKTMIMALSMHAEPKPALDMLEAGASAYLLKDCAAEELVKAIRIVVAHGTYLSPKIARLILKDYNRMSGNEPSLFLNEMSRSREFLQLMAEGCNAMEIASAFNLDIEIAESYYHRLMCYHIAPSLFRNARGSKRKDVFLTVREREVLLWVKEGKSNAEISILLGITRDAVKFHLKNVFKKLNITSRTQAVASVIESKVIDS